MNFFQVLFFSFKQYSNRLRTITLNSLLIALTLIGHNMDAYGDDVSSGEFRLRPTIVSTENSEEDNSHNKIENTRTVDSAILESTDVDIEVNGIIARVIVKQRFKNTSAYWAEGEYVFPLPNNSAVDYMAMQIGERKIIGTIREKNIAKNLYEKAKSAGKKASLVSQQRPNLFTNTVANVAPGESITVELRYIETLRYDQGRFSLRVPTTITPRYIPGQAFSHMKNPESFETINISDSETSSGNTTEGGVINILDDVSKISPPMISSTNASPITLSASINAGIELEEIKSLYHNFNQRRFGNIYKLEIDPTSQSNKDIVIEWTPKTGQAPIATSFKENIDNDEYILLMVMPPQNITQDKILPKETIFIIDTSGSMAGQSIIQARNALLSSLDYLNPTDRFNIIEFNSQHRSLFHNPVNANTSNIRQAKKFISHLNAEGGTEMAGALTEAFSNESAEGFVRQIIFITDGSVGNEDSLFSLIENKKGNSRLFTVGIGSAPNSHFMQKAADSGQGTFTYISTQSDISKGISDLFYKLKNPIMTHINVNFNGFDNAQDIEIFPRQTPDLYAGEPLIIAAKLPVNTVKNNHSVSINGSLQNKNYQQTVHLNTNKYSKSISKLWARKKLDALYDEERKSRYSSNKKEQQTLKNEITTLALNHKLLSKYTSFLAIEETISRPQSTHLSKTKIPDAMPEGSMQPIPMPSSSLGLLSLWYAVLACFFAAFTLNTKNILSRMAHPKKSFTG